MKTDPQQRLEAVVQRELSRLELVPAPPTLLPRIMNAVAREASRCARPRWLAWPPWVRLPLVIFSSASLGYGLWRASEWFVGLGAGLVPDSAQLVARIGVEVSRSLATAAQALLQEWLRVALMSGYVLIPLMVAGLLLSALGAVLVRLLSCTGPAFTQARHP